VNVWKIVFATLVIFVAGIVTGATLVRIAQVGPPPWRIRRAAVENRSQPFPVAPVNPNTPIEPRPAASGGQPQGLLGREFIQVLERQLQLTPEQREKIGRIMADGQERVRQLRSRIDPELRKELQQTKEQIRLVLTPEQREQFEQLMKRTPRRNERGEPPGQPERRPRDGREPRNPPPPDAPSGGEPRDSQPPPQPQHL
jgi:Spy/CpxP family protein refolding chaperone